MSVSLEIFLNFKMKKGLRKTLLSIFGGGIVYKHYSLKQNGTRENV